MVQSYQRRLNRCLLYLFIIAIIYGINMILFDWKFSHAADDFHSTSNTQNIPLYEERIMASSTLVVAQTNISPFLYITPSQDGTTLYIQTEEMIEIGGDLVLQTSLANGGPHIIGRWAGVYSDTEKAYVAVIPGFAPEHDIVGSIGITSTTGINTGNEQIHRMAIDVSQERQTIISENGQFELILHASETLPTDTYVAMHAHQSGSIPKSLPDDVRLVGYAYSALVSGATHTSAKPMTLRLYYTQETLGGYDPETLVIMAWNNADNVWEEMNTQLWPGQQYVSTETHKFTGYALVSKPRATDAWIDEFEFGFRYIDFLNFAGLTTERDVDDSSDFIVKLTSFATSGYAATKPITLPAEALGWDRVTFEAIGNAVVDVLDQDGNVLLADIANGASLAGIDHSTNPSLRLKVSMTANEQRLDWWALSWLVEEETPDCIDGDIDCNGFVNLDDFGILQAAFGTCAGQAGYDEAADLQPDDCINLDDFGILQVNFGRQKSE